MKESVHRTRHSSTPAFLIFFNRHPLLLSLGFGPYISSQRLHYKGPQVIAQEPGCVCLSYCPAARGPKGPWQQHQYCFTNSPFPVPGGISVKVGLSDFLHLKSAKEDKTNQRESKKRQRRGAHSRADPALSPLLPHPGVSPVPPRSRPAPPPPPKTPCTQPLCSARRSAPPPWLARPRKFLGLRGHTGVSSHTFSLSSSAYSSPAELRLYPLRSGGTWTVVHRSHTASTVSGDLADLVTGTSQSLHAR